ncbi:MAG: hypothetical protein OXE84_13205 [Rhodobacteraceae bacterium]|nr:hypothetical protein [Paracoccaceae bacterium]
MFCGRKFPEELKTQISSVKMILTASSSTVNIAKLPAVGTSLYLPHKEDQAIDSLRATLADYDIASSDYNNVNDWHKFCCRLESCQSIKMAKIIGEEFQNESQ